MPIFKLVLVSLLVFSFCGLDLPTLWGQEAPPDSGGAPPPSPPASALTVQRLFDGASLAGWRVLSFGGEGDVSVSNGALVLDMGSPLTGVVYAGTKPLPRMNYEVRWEARRVEGSDFFCGLTFPYNDSSGTLILGGWGGGLVGVSSLDGQDASENETTSYMGFEKDRWYALRLRVREGFISAWIDGTQVVACRVGDRQVSTRAEVALCVPLGIATYQTRGEIRDLQLRSFAVDPARRGSDPRRLVP